MTGPEGALEFCKDYSRRLGEVLNHADWSGVGRLAADLKLAQEQRRQVFLFGNGGSAGNAIHLANDFLYGVAKCTGGGLNVHSLSSNQAVMTCLANDVGYERVFAEQLAVHARPGDLAIALSGSGNSPNILAALEQARSSGMTSYAILGFDGGKSKSLADVAIHFAVNDMQIAEDLQLIVGHMLMQRLWAEREQTGH